MGAPPYRIWEMLNRSETGIFMEEKDFVSKRLIPEIQKAVKKHGVKYDPAFPVNISDSMADKVWNAAVDAFLAIGVYNKSAHRVIEFTEEEIKDYMTKDNREFRVLKYEALDCEQEYGVCEKCNTPWDEHEHSCTVNMTQNYNEQTLLQMEQYLEERIAYYKSISLVKSNRDFCFGYGNEQRKVLEEALEYFIKLKNVGKIFSV